MSQLVFIHGPGAGACAEGFTHQMDRFHGSFAPNLPGHLSGEPCPDVDRYAEWLRGWLWANGAKKDLVLCGFTLGACIALQYALDYPEEVKGLVLMTVAMKPKERAPGTLELRLEAAKTPKGLENWLEAMREAMVFIEPELRERLIECHRKVGPISQYNDLLTIDKFDVTGRIGSLKPPLLLIRGVDDPLKPPDYEQEIHQAVPGSQYLRLSQAGHFPMAEKPEEVNQAIADFITELSPS